MYRQCHVQVVCMQPHTYLQCCTSPTSPQSASSTLTYLGSTRCRNDTDCVRKTLPHGRGHRGDRAEDDVIGSLVVLHITNEGLVWDKHTSYTPSYSHQMDLPIQGVHHSAAMKKLNSLKIIKGNVNFPLRTKTFLPSI